MLFERKVSGKEQMCAGGDAHQKTKTEQPEDPERDDGGDEEGGGEVDGGLGPVHREAREGVRVEGLVVLLVHPAGTTRTSRDVGSLRQLIIVAFVACVM